MLAAASWDGREGPTVVGRLRQVAAGMPDGDVACRVVAIIFAQPDSRVVATARRRKEYFDARSGEGWDLYFAGYYRYGLMPGGQALTEDGDSAQFSARAFDTLRRHVQCVSNWRYSGDCDLIVVNAYLTRDAEPVVDWPSLLGGALVDPNDAYRALSICGIVEAISHAVEHDFEAADWNVGDTLWPRDRGPESRLVKFGRDVLAQAVANVLSSPLSH